MQTSTEKFNMRDIISRYRVLFIIFIILSLGTFVFIISSLSPLILDDYNFKYINPGLPPFTSLGSIAKEFPGLDFDLIFKSTKNVYFHWSGRFCYIFTGYFFANIPKPYFNICNAVIAMIVLWLIIKLSAGQRKITVGFTLSCTALFLLSCPAPGLTLFWLAGAINYLWPAMFYLAFLLPFRMVAEYGFSPQKHININLIFPVMFAGFIGCNTNENTGGAVILIAILFSIYSYLKFHRVLLWQIFGFFGAIMGFCALIFAPGQLQRMTLENHQSVNVINKILVQSAYLFQQILYLLPLIILMIGVLFIVIERKKFSKTITISTIMIVGGLASCYVMIFSPYSPGRTMFGTFIFLLIAWGMLYHKFLELETSIFRRAELLFSLSLILIAAPVMLYALRDIYFTSNVVKRRQEYMINASKNGVTDVTFRPIVGISPYNVMFKTDILSDNDNHFVNRYIASKSGLKKLRISPHPAVVGMIDDIKLPKQNYKSE